MVCRLQIPALAVFAVLLTGTVAHAQTPETKASTPDASPSVPNQPPGAASPFILEPDAQIQGDRIKQETYRSQPAGQNRKWNLDIGRFQHQIDDDPYIANTDPVENYSGMRLRLPLRGGLGQ